MSNGRDETAGRGNDPQFDSRQADVPLPGFALPVLTLDQRIRDARQVVIDAKGEHDPVATFLLFSGGNDSLVLLDVLWNLADAVFHVETGIGIKQTDDHARQVAARYDLPYIVGHPPESYDSLVLGPWNGMPEPGAHRYTYIQLKERCIEALIRDHRTRRGQRFLLLDRKSVV